MKDFIEFVDTGKFITRKDFLSKRPKEVLLKDCIDLVHYEGGHYIQVLNDGTFYLDELNQSKELEEVEITLHTRLIKPKENKKMNLSDQINSNLPFISYGSFKPGELRYNLIKEHVQNYEKIKILGQMEEKDGIPIFKKCREGYVKFSYEAYALNFKSGHSQLAYEKIIQSEENTFYIWDTLENKNILIGKHNLKGTIPFLEEIWTFQNDPYFKSGIHTAERIFKLKEEGSIIKDEFFEFFKTSSSYMLLWTIIERFCTLKYGNLSLPSQKVKSLAEDPEIEWNKILSNISRKDSIYRSDRINDILILDKNKSPKKNLDYYYGIRSNMVHRGKDAFVDSIRISDAFIELKMIFESILENHNYYNNTKPKQIRN